MANLRGFPPSNTISPSVRIIEKDLSLVLPAPNFHRAGLVGFASKGPINLPTLIRSRRELHRTFGFPHPQEGDPYLIYAAEQYLLVATELYIVRVADESPVSNEQAETAYVTVPSAGGLVRIESDETGPYTFADDKFFRWRLNGVLASKTLTVLADTYTTDELVDALNDQLTASIDGIEFYNNSDKIALKSVYSYGPSAEIELVSIQDAMYGGAVADGNVSGLGISMTRAVINGTKTKYPDNSYQTAGQYDFSGLTDLNLQVVVDGTDNIDVDGIVQVIDLADLEGSDNALADIITEINSQAVGFEAYEVASSNALSLRTLAYGRDSKVVVKASSTADAIFGLSNATAEGSSPIRVTGDTDTEAAGRVTGKANTSTVVAFTLEADSPGIEGNNTQVIITTDENNGKWNFQVFSNGQEVEKWGGLTKDSSDRLYIESFLAEASDFIRCVDNTDTTESPIDGTYTLSGGTDGIPSDPDEIDSLLIGNDVAMTGMQAFSDPEQVDIDLIAVPGHPSTDVIVALLDLCQNKRQDCFAIIDPPFGLSVDEIIDWQNGTHPLNLTRFDSDFGALYWPWVRIRDTTNRIDVWVPPSGSVLAAYARSDTLSAPWFAPAGLTRGIVPNITNVFSRPTLEERDKMYGYSNAINPIVQFQDVSDYVIWGQKTLQRRPTALDRVNVRRMLLVAEKRIRNVTRTLLFEPHDAGLRSEFIRLATGVLEEIKSQRGINEFLVQCDDELNPSDVVDRNELVARIGIQPLRAVEFVYIEFSIHRTGSFTENADTF